MEDTKVCPRCAESKPLDEFVRRKNRPSGRGSWCKACFSAYTVARRDKDHKRAYDAAYRMANPDKKRAIYKRWYDRHPQKSAAKVKAWQAANPEQAKRHHDTYRECNPHIGRVAQHNRRALIRASGGKLSTGLPVLLFAEQGGKCPYCLAHLSETGYHLDHYLPIALGGANDDSNAQLLCPNCNRRKSGKHPKEFEATLGWLCARTEESPIQMAPERG
jgi:5-methylcytosine-specific restriction endonuclease McrA